MSAQPRSAPPVTNSRLASALLALAAHEAPGSRPATEYRAAAWTLRQIEVDVHGRRIRIASLPDVSSRAADAISGFLACGSDEVIDEHLAAILDRRDPAEDLKRDFLSRADVDRILEGPGLSLADIRADLHLHTDRSDGKLPLPALYRALASRGDSYALLTDHARDCAVAGGLFPADFRAQRRQVDELNESSETGFVMLLGAEANVDEDGALDVIPARVPELAAVVASVHTNLRSPRDQTARLVRAIQTPGVAFLGHPRGRLYALRGGVRADWPRVFAAASARGVAVELNGCPERLDLDPRLAHLACEAGCIFSISSDAHARRHLDFLRYGLAVARMAGIPAGRIVNTFPHDRFLEWLAERRQ